MLIWVLNAGSTALKCQLLDISEVSLQAKGALKPFEKILANGKIRKVGSKNALVSFETPRKRISGRKTSQAKNLSSALELLWKLILNNDVISSPNDLDACAFKTVHLRGASRAEDAVLLSAEILQRMRDYNEVAVAHNPPYIELIEACQKLLPDVPLIGAFEFAYHQTIPPEAYFYSVPYEWCEQYGIRRYGFHGASHRYVAERVQELFPEKNDLKLINVHLGGSSSLCAIKNGISIDTSMGFSPQGDILNATRIGNLDSFAALWLLEHTNMDIDELREVLCQRSGLFGVSGIQGGNLTQIQKEAKTGNERCRLALKLYIYGIKKIIGSYIVALGGLDILAFTGGIGEHEPQIRRQICENLEFMDIRIDAQRNWKGIDECVISSQDSNVKVMIIPTHEELIVARRALACLIRNP